MSTMFPSISYRTHLCLMAPGETLMVPVGSTRWYTRVTTRYACVRYDREYTELELCLAPYITQIPTHFTYDTTPLILGKATLCVPLCEVDLSGVDAIRVRLRPSVRA